MSDLLFLAHRLPFPPDRGDKIRGYHVLRHLTGRSRVHLVAFADDARDLTPDPAFTAGLASCTVVPRRKPISLAAIEALASGRPVSLTAFADQRLAAVAAEVRARHPIAATYVFSGQMAQYTAPGEHTVMDFVDVDSAKFVSYAEQRRGPAAWMMRREARLLGAWERAVAERTSAVFVSAAEARLFGGGTPIENGIDAQAFAPGRVAPVNEGAPLIAFTGQMDYPPNVAAVTWFAREVLPLIRRSHPAARFAIVGRAPTVAVCALAGEAVIVSGEVADVRPWLKAATVVVAPLRLARGIQNKVLEAMAMARAVVASPAAAEGIDHAGTLRIAAGAPAFAAEVTGLIADRVEADRLGAAARARVIARYDWQATLAPLDALLGPGARMDRAA